MTFWQWIFDDIPFEFNSWYLSSGGEFHHNHMYISLLTCIFIHFPWLCRKSVLIKVLLSFYLRMRLFLCGCCQCWANEWIWIIWNANKIHYILILSINMQGKLITYSALDQTWCSLHVLFYYHHTSSWIIMR